MRSRSESDNFIVNIASLPAGYGGWNPTKQKQCCSISEEETVSTSSERERRDNQILAYTSWVNAQLKKKPGRQCIGDLVSDMQDGTAFADLIEVIAGQRLPGVTYAPSTKREMLLNVEKVISFMMEKNIRMHVTSAEDIVSGRVNAIMRLVLALAAHYKPNSVRESRHRSSLASYAQSAAVKLAEARRDAAVVVHKPRKPNPVCDGTPSNVKTTSSIYTPLQKSASQDFVPGYGDGRYRALAESYTCLSKDHEMLKVDYDNAVRLQEEIYVEVKRLKKVVLLLQQLLLENKLTDSCEESLGDSALTSLLSIQPMSAEETALLCSRLLHSEETQRDIKDELSRMRNDCMRRQGAEAGLQQLVEDQQNAVLKLEAELMKTHLANQSLENTKTVLEQQLHGQQSQIDELTKELLCRNQEMAQLKQELAELRQPDCSYAETTGSCYTQSDDRRMATDGGSSCSSQQQVNQRLQFVESPRHAARRTRGALSLTNHDNGSVATNGTSTRLVYYCSLGSNLPLFSTISKAGNEITLSDIQSVVGARDRCRYHFQTADSATRCEVKDRNALVPCNNGTVTVWVEDSIH